MKKTVFFIAFLVQCSFVFSQAGKIFTTSNRIIDCSYIQNKRFGVEYISVNSTDGTKDYLAHTKIDRIEYENGDIEYISGSPTKDHKNRSRKDPKDFTYLSPSYVSVNVGPAISMPWLDFQSQYMGNLTYTGPNVIIDAMYSPDIFSGLGLAGYLGYSYNPIEPTVLNNTLQNQLPSNVTNVSIQNSGWNNIYFMGGVDYYLETNGRWMFDAKILLGGMYSFHPSATASYDTSGVHFKTTIKTDDLFLCLGGQLSARYFITRKLSLKASLNATLAGGGFSELRREDYQGTKMISQSTIAGPGDAYVHWMGITFGIAYTLGK